MKTPHERARETAEKLIGKDGPCVPSYRCDIEGEAVVAIIESALTAAEARAFFEDVRKLNSPTPPAQSATPRTRAAAIPAHYVTSKYGENEMFVPLAACEKIETELAAKDAELTAIRTALAQKESP